MKQNKTKSSRTFYLSDIILYKLNKLSEKHNNNLSEVLEMILKKYFKIN